MNIRVLRSFLLSLCSLSLLMSGELRAQTKTQSSIFQLDPRVKAVGSMALYGSIGGLLLGTASLAFGAKSKSVPQGASLGLYAGLLFGAYVVASHYLRGGKEREIPLDPPKFYRGERPTWDSPLKPISEQRFFPSLAVNLIDFRF